MFRVLPVVCLVILGFAGMAAAGPLLELSQQTAPFGTSQVVVTVVGTPLHFFAVGSSTANSGLTVGGLSLQLGTDAALAGGRAARCPGAGQLHLGPRAGAEHGTSPGLHGA